MQKNYIVWKVVFLRPDFHKKTPESRFSDLILSQRFLSKSIKAKFKLL